MNEALNHMLAKLDDVRYQEMLDTNKDLLAEIVQENRNNIIHNLSYISCSVERYGTPKYDEYGEERFYYNEEYTSIFYDLEKRYVYTVKHKGVTLLEVVFIGDDRLDVMLSTANRFCDEMNNGTLDKTFMYIILGKQKQYEKHDGLYFYKVENTDRHDDIKITRNVDLQKRYEELIRKEEESDE